jgi:hypothetical protein
VSVSESQGWNAVYRTHCQQSAISLLLKLLVESYSFAALRIATKSLSFSFSWDFGISNTRTQAFWASFSWQSASDLLRHPELIPWPSQATGYSYLIFDTRKTAQSGISSFACNWVQLPEPGFVRSLHRLFKMTIKIPWSAVYLAIAASVYMRPQYTILDSPTATFVVLSLAITLFRIIYALVLYPKFLTPIKHIPTPPVRIFIARTEQVLNL